MFLNERLAHKCSLIKRSLIRFANQSGHFLWKVQVKYQTVCHCQPWQKTLKMMTHLKCSDKGCSVVYILVLCGFSTIKVSLLQLKLVPISVALTDYEYFFSLLYWMSVHHRIPQPNLKTSILQQEVVVMSTL